MQSQTIPGDAARPRINPFSKGEISLQPTLSQEWAEASAALQVSQGNSGLGERGTGSSTRVLFIKLPAPGVGLLTLPSGDCHCHLLTDAQSLAANDVF